MQNYVDNKFHQRWNTAENIWRTAMLPLFGGWASTSIFRISQHSPLHHNISWQFSYPCCPSQGICPPCAVQTLVSLSGNNWSVGWSYCSASLCYLLDVRGSRTLDSLLLRRDSSLHHRLSIMWSFFVDDGGNKRGQTSRPVGRAEIQIQYSSQLGVVLAMEVILVFFNSTLNPFLYCWKITEVRRAMKQTIRQALCCPWS